MIWDAAKTRTEHLIILVVILCFHKSYSRKSHLTSVSLNETLALRGFYIEQMYPPIDMFRRDK